MSENNAKPTDDKDQKPADSSSGQQQNPDKVAELEKKLGEMAKFQEDTKQFIAGATVVVNTLAYDPELREAFQKKLKGEYGMVDDGQKPSQQQKQNDQTKKTDVISDDKVKAVDERVTGVEVSQREEVIKGFEKEFGIDKMPKEEADESRRKIESYLNDFGLSVNNTPLQVLHKNLEKAFVGTHAEKLREEGKLEGMIKTRELDNGTMGSFSGQRLQDSETTELTSKQKEWAKKLGVDEKKVVETYKNRAEEQTRVSPSETKK